MNSHLVELVRTLSTYKNDPSIYRAALGILSRETGTDIMEARRADEKGRWTVDRVSGTSQPGAEEREQLLSSAFSDDDSLSARARDQILRSDWATLLETKHKKEGKPIFALAAGVSRGALSPRTRDALLMAMNIMEPLLETRFAMAEQLLANERNRKEMRANELELLRFFEFSKDMIYTTNAEDRFAAINDAGISLLGAENRFDVVGRTFSEFALNPDDRGYFLSRIREAGFVRDHEIIIGKEGAEPAFCIETAHAVLNPDGSIASVQGIVKDISERIKNEKALWKANLELAETNERLQKTQLALIQQEKLASIGQLAAGVAHEINNPLGFMKSNFATAREYTDALKRAWLEAKGKLPGQDAADIESRNDLEFILAEMPRMFEETADGYARIIEIISQLKSFARMDSEPKRERYDLEIGIESSLVIAWNEIKYIADVRRNFAGVSPIEAEGGAINQVVLNILVNASQAIAGQKRKDRGSIVISTREDADSVYCLIADDGPGMTEEVQRRIFDPFFTTKEPGKGTGLGLSVSYDIIVTKHGGKLSVVSKPGAGATFEISLPKKALPRV